MQLLVTINGIILNSLHFFNNYNNNFGSVKDVDNIDT